MIESFSSIMKELIKDSNISKAVRDEYNKKFKSLAQDDDDPIYLSD